MRKDGRKRQIQKIKTHRYRAQRKRGCQKWQEREEVNRLIREELVLRAERDRLREVQFALEEENRKIEARLSMQKEKQKQFAIKQGLGKNTLAIIDLMYKKDPQTGKIPTALKVSIGIREFSVRHSENIIEIESLRRRKAISIPAC